MEEHARRREPGKSARRARAAWGPEDREPQVLPEPVAGLRGQARALEELEQQREVRHPPAALRDPEPAAPAHAALAERVALGRAREERERLVEPVDLLEPAPGDLRVARKAEREPARHREGEGVIERRAGDAGVVEAPAGRDAEPRHAHRESREGPVDARQDLGVVGVRLEETEGLVQAEERRGLPHAGRLEPRQELELRLPGVGRVPRGDGRQAVREIAAGRHLDV